MDEQGPTKVINDFCTALLKHEELVLKVKVNTAEDAEQLMRWMYGSDKPMTAELHSIGWDQGVIPKAEYDALQALKEAIRL